jgi:hypothetical protein
VTDPSGGAQLASRAAAQRESLYLLRGRLPCAARSKKAEDLAGRDSKRQALDSWMVRAFIDELEIGNINHALHTFRPVEVTQASRAVTPT